MCSVLSREMSLPEGTKANMVHVKRGLVHSGDPTSRSDSVELGRFKPFCLTPNSIQPAPNINKVVGIRLRQRASGRDARGGSQQRAPRAPGLAQRGARAALRREAHPGGRRPSAQRAHGGGVVAAPLQVPATWGQKRIPRPVLILMSFVVLIESSRVELGGGVAVRKRFFFRTRPPLKVASRPGPRARDRRWRSPQARAATRPRPRRGPCGRPSGRSAGVRAARARP